MDYNLPIINSIEDCEKYLSNVITISLLDDYDKFDECYYYIYKLLCACIDLKECAAYNVKFKFYPEDQTIYELSIPKMLLNMNAWRPLIELNTIQKFYTNKIEILDESFIVGIMMSNTLRVGLESKVLKVLNDYGIPFERVSQLLKIVIERYQQMALEFSLIDKSSIMTLESIFLKDYMESEKIKELNNIEIPQDLQTADVEILLKKKYRELINELSVRKNPIWYVSTAGNHIKAKQVEELYISYGQIPDVGGNVIPYTMEGNGFATGYVDPISYYIAATGARLSAIMNKAHMGEAGYLSRNLILASRTLELSKTMYDCGTKHLLPLMVTDNTFLHRLQNKWFCENLGDKLECIDYDKHKYLVGKKIWIRSLITCAGGDECCHVCYGRDSHLVANMPGMGIFNTEVYSEPVSQNILSTKHLLFTAANRIDFNNSFNKYFKFNAGDIFIKDVNEWDYEIPGEILTIRIPSSNVIAVNNNDIQENNTFGNNIESPFYVYNTKTKEYDKIEITNYDTMFIDHDSMKLFKIITDKIDGEKTSFYEASLQSILEELDGRVLAIDIKNNGLTDNLYSIMNLLNKNASKYEDYAVLAQEFFEFLINAGINCRHVQAEVILNRLIRDANDIYKRPDFSQFKDPEYKILNLNQALLNTNAPTIGMSYQEQKRQLITSQLYEKTGNSYLDPLYSTRVNTSRLKELIEIRRKRKESTVE